MFDAITSAGPKRGRRAANWTVVSILLHSTVIGLAAVATYVKAHAPVKEEPVNVTFRAAPPPPPPPPPPAGHKPKTQRTTPKPTTPKVPPRTMVQPKEQPKVEEKPPEDLPENENDTDDEG